MPGTEVCIEEELRVLAGDLPMLARVGQWKRTMALGQALTVNVLTRTYAPVLRRGDRVEVHRCAPQDLRPGDIVMCFVSESIDFRRVLEVRGEGPNRLVVVFGSDDIRWVLSSQVLGRAVRMARTNLLTRAVRGMVRSMAAVVTAVASIRRGRIR